MTEYAKKVKKDTLKIMKKYPELKIGQVVGLLNKNGCPVTVDGLSVILTLK